MWKKIRKLHIQQIDGKVGLSGHLYLQEENTWTKKIVNLVHKDQNWMEGVVNSNLRKRHFSVEEMAGDEWRLPSGRSCTGWSIQPVTRIYIYIKYLLQSRYSINVQFSFSFAHSHLLITTMQWLCGDMPAMDGRWQSSRNPPLCVSGANFCFN